MSTQDTRKVVSRAVMDDGFRNLLFSDPEQALAGYDLTGDEVSALRAIPAETIDDFANHLDERISMSVISWGAQVFGEDAMGHDATGQATMGHDATGQATMGHDATGQAAYGNEAAGQAAYGNEAAGQAAYGNEAAGQAAYGNEAAGQAAYGNEATGNDVFGNDVTGSAVMGGGESQVDASQPMNWLARLSAALGFHGTGGSTGEVNYY